MPPVTPAAAQAEGITRLPNAWRKGDDAARDRLFVLVYEELRRRAAGRLRRERQRFHRERQILGRLQHPNIAAIFDGGSTEEGQPYLVMECVEGETIDRYCAARQVRTRERLELFRQVCAAVHYAHQNLVIHRDLKPGNILVTADGTPKLLDFGIAKLLAAGLDPDEAPTATLLPMMTPEYASPEQVKGAAVTRPATSSPLRSCTGIWTRSFSRRCARSRSDATRQCRISRRTSAAT